jgi:YHS domain-containing protein
MKMLATLCLVAAAAAAQEPTTRASSPFRVEPRAGEPQLALDGLDPIALCEGREVRGDARWSAARGRFTYHFESEAALARFRAAPERFEIQWGGGCGRMGPLSGTGDPGRHLVHDGRLWIFASDGCRQGFAAAPERFVPPAEAPIESTPAAAEAGRAWIERAVSAHGGPQRLAPTVALWFEDDNEQDGWLSFADLVVRFDGAVHERSRWIGPEAGRGFDSLWVVGAQDFLVEQGAWFEIVSRDQRLDLVRTAQRHPLVLLAARDAEDFAAHELGRSTLAGGEVVDVHVRSAGLETVLHLDPHSGRVRGLSWRGRLADGPMRAVVETFETYLDRGGLLVPDRRSVTVDGRPSDAHSKGWDRVHVVRDCPAAPFELATCLAEFTFGENQR